MSQKFFELKPKNILPLTDDAVEIRFDIPTAIAEEFHYASGQYITIEASIKGEQVRRAYSICSAPHEAFLAIGVKKVQGGKMSPFLVDQLTVDSTLQVMPPEGRFIVKPNGEIARDHYFFAAGSGITPIYSMIKNLLENEPKSTCYLLYGNKSKETTMFALALEALASKYKDQLYIVNTYSQASKGLLAKFFNRDENAPLEGRIGKENIEKLQEKYPHRNDKQQFYICGPGNMITQTKDILEASFVKKTDIKTEFFSSPTEASSKTTAISTGGSSKVNVHLDDEILEIEIEQGEILLDKLLDLGHDAPYSCKSGSCSSCIAKVINGSVTMDTCLALDDDEVEEGYILACQAKVISNEAEIEFMD